MASTPHLAQHGARVRRGEGRGTIRYPDLVVDRQSAVGAERATLTPTAGGSTPQ